jgi:glycosyltransferase involved in cell wall biosynthesis
MNEHIVSFEQHIKEKYRIKKQINLIYQGVDKTVFDPEAVGKERIERNQKSWRIDPERQVIILHGRLTRLKGQDLFIQALALMKNQNYQAVLIGDFEENPGFTDELLKTIRHNGLGGKVKVAEHCDDMPAALMLAGQARRSCRISQST